MVIKWGRKRWAWHAAQWCMRNLNKLLLRTDRKRIFSREDKLSLNKHVWELLDSSDSNLDPEEGSCKQRKKPLHSTKGKVFLEHVSDYQLLKELFSKSDRQPALLCLFFFFTVLFHLKLPALHAVHETFDMTLVSTSCTTCFRLNNLKALSTILGRCRPLLRSSLNSPSRSSNSRV
jgi:hypothetical protein